MPDPRTSPRLFTRLLARVILHGIPMPDPWEEEFHRRYQATEWLSKDSDYLQDRAAVLMGWLDRSIPSLNIWAFNTAKDKVNQILAEISSNTDAIHAFNDWATEAISEHYDQSGSPLLN